jgi:hypothetical protein
MFTGQQQKVATCLIISASESTGLFVAVVTHTTWLASSESGKVVGLLFEPRQAATTPASNTRLSLPEKHRHRHRHDTHLESTYDRITPHSADTMSILLCRTSNVTTTTNTNP